MIVPNQFPARSAARRIAIVGEAPGEHEQRLGRPFVGPSGQLLTAFLAHVGIDREACFIGNVTGHRPPGNNIELFKWSGDEVQSGLAQLRDDLTRYAPHFVLCLGGTALRAFAGERRSVDDWRGSLFISAPDSPCPGVKCISTFHPARVLREFSLQGVVRFDLKRAAAESQTDALELPAYNIELMLPGRVTATQVCERMHALRAGKCLTALDIEGGCGLGPACIGFATSATEAFVVPFYGVDGLSIWPEEDEVLIWEAVAAYLEDPECLKIIMNALYEMFVLAWSLGIVIAGLQDDIMLKHFELYCEMDKSLGFQASIYTKQPHWKLEHRFVNGRYVPYRNGRPVSTEEWLIYNATDCCVTWACNDAQEALLRPQQRDHYRLNLSLLTPLLHMELRGIRYDKEEAQRRLAATRETIYELQDEINREAARSPDRPALAAFYAALRDPALRDDATTGQDAVRGLLPLFADAFCCARRVEQREVEEVTWQPHAWNGKRWVKRGKRVDDVPSDAIAWGDAPIPTTADKACIVYTSCRKRVTRNVPVAITTLADVERFTLDSKAADCKRACAILAATQGKHDAHGLTPAQRGELAQLLGIHVKVNAAGRKRDRHNEDGTIDKGAEKDANWYIYTHCALPRQYQKDGNRLTDKLACDDEALIKAYLKSGKDDATRDQRALRFLDMRRAITQTKTLKAECDKDGRIRCSYNLVGTETHRLTCYESPTKSGYNLQTVTKKHRDLFRADEGCEMCQRDLSGADGWTVAAYAAMLGDTAMLEDYRAKLKPAQIIVLMLDQGAAVNAIPRDALRPLCKPITEEADWRYFAMKRLQHGGSYMMGKMTTSDQVLTDSFKKDGRPIYIEPSRCEAILQQCFFVRYPGIKRLHAWMAQEIKTRGVLVASNGFQRRFFGRKDDASTVRQALAHLPQVYTTYATTLALSRLWTDPSNRRDDGSLRVEPLHTVHDSLVTQWRVEDRAYGCERMHAWFDNELVIAQERITIPASGTYGPSWGEQDEAL